MENYLDIARRVFEGTRYKATNEDIKKLADNMLLLEKRGLGTLNKRLVDARKHSKIFETIAEHNFAVILVLQHSSEVPISYEPDLETLRPPDFKVEIGNVTYWVQMKDLSKLERENRQDKIIQHIKREAKEIKVSKYFSCILSDDFRESCVPELIDFLKDRAASAGEGESFLFTSENNQKAKIAFWLPINVDLMHLTLGIAGDVVAVEITGQTKEQIKQSLLNAAGAFNWKSDQKNINLIVIEADNKEDIDICDAFFGTEYDEFSNGGHLGWNRKDDGLFKESDFSKRVAGVIAIKRKEKWHPVSSYHMILYVNDSFNDLLENIKKLLSFDIVIYYNMRPPMGQGNFAYRTEEVGP